MMSYHLSKIIKILKSQVEFVVSIEKVLEAIIHCKCYDEKLIILFIVKVKQ